MSNKSLKKTKTDILVAMMGVRHTTLQARPLMVATIIFIHRCLFLFIIILIISKIEILTYKK